MITETKVLPKPLEQNFNKLLLEQSPFQDRTDEQTMKKFFREDAKKLFVSKNKLKVSSKKVKHSIKSQVKRRSLMIKFMEEYAEERWKKCYWNPEYRNALKKMAPKATQTMRFRRQFPPVKDYPRVI